MGCCEVAGCIIATVHPATPYLDFMGDTASEVVRRGLIERFETVMGALVA
ncbi:MAG TPA: hypothetical protein VKQ30_17830 [Ktedonobacterales bacterium]|nr:hypothetical protein [Ktedonobacterales bacterium]